MSAATSSRSSATWSRSASAWCSERQAQGGARRKAAARGRGARARRAGRRRAPAPATRDSFRKQAARRRARRQGDRDRGRSDTGDGMPTFEIPGMPGAPIGVINLGDMFGKAFGGPHQDAHASRCKDALRAAGRRGEPTSCSTRTRSCRRRSSTSRTTASSSSTRSTRSAPATSRVGADVSREGVQRDLLPLIEGTTVAHQVRAGEDRPHPVHRLGRVPRRQAVGPAAGAAGPPADPRRAAAR